MNKNASTVWASIAGLLGASTLGLMFALLTAPAAAQIGSAAGSACVSWLDHEVGRLNSSARLDLCELTAGKTVLIVNTASFCGFTPQFEGLEALYQEYKDRGLVIVGFPSDDFNQESDDAAEIAEVCFINYGVSFPMSAVVKVKGADAHPIFQMLAVKGEPRWNFNKYLVSSSGEVIARYDSSVNPDSVQLLSAIEQLL
jgi:glutathione peroxidase